MYPRITISGNFDAGLVIDAWLPSHLASADLAGGDAHRCLVLTPLQSRELMRRLQEIAAPAPPPTKEIDWGPNQGKEEL